VNFANELGLTPLHFAAVHSRVSVAKALVKARADLCARTSDEHHLMPVDIAEGQGCTDMISIVDPAGPSLELAMKLLQQGLVVEAASHGREALALRPSAVAYAVLGDACSAMERVDEAIDAYGHALSLRPKWQTVYGSLAMVLLVASRHEEALTVAAHGCSLQPGDAKTLTVLASASQHVCEWSGFHELREDLMKAVGKDLDNGVVPELQPWIAATYPLDVDVVLRLTRAHSNHVLRCAQNLGCSQFALPRSLCSGERLRVAYICSEFGNHPVGQLMGSVFGLHDRSEVEVFVYSMGPNDSSSWYKRVQASAEHFVDVFTWDIVSIAQRINNDGIHVAVNINGYTKGARNEVFALRCAPLQVQFLGFPATMAASWIDYLVADTTVAPPELRHCYGEPLALMPHCMIPTDHKQAHGELLTSPRPSRAEYGLPEEGVVYSCHQQLFKLDPDLFSVWCRILERVPSSVLWLLRSPPAAEPRLRREAERQGIDPSRLIFADRVPTAEYVRRQALGDVFLDTPVYNAFTTGCDALWAGCPLVTFPLERMASRVGASLAAATGLHMEVRSYPEYEDLAVMLGTDDDKRHALRSELLNARRTCPLFDTHTWVRDFERLVRSLWDRHVAGEPPETVTLDVMPPVSAEGRRPPSRYFHDPKAQNLDADTLMSGIVK